MLGKLFSSAFAPIQCSHHVGGYPSLLPLIDSIYVSYIFFNNSRHIFFRHRITDDNFGQDGQQQEQSERYPFRDVRALIDAIEGNKLDSIRQILEKTPWNTQVCFCMPPRATEYMPFHWATSLGRIDVMQMLMQEYNFDIELGDRDIPSALHFAPDIRTLRWLLDHGANVLALDRSTSLLHKHCRQYSGIDIFQLLIDSGANVNARDWRGDTPMHVILDGPIDDVQLAKIQALIDAGADATISNDNGLVPIERDTRIRAMWNQRHERSVQLLRDARSEISRLKKNEMQRNAFQSFIESAKLFLDSCDPASQICKRVRDTAVEISSIETELGQLVASLDSDNSQESYQKATKCLERLRSTREASVQQAQEAIPLLRKRLQEVSAQDFKEIIDQLSIIEKKSREELQEVEEFLQVVQQKREASASRRTLLQEKIVQHDTIQDSMENDELTIAELEVEILKGRRKSKSQPTPENQTQLDTLVQRQQQTKQQLSGKKRRLAELSEEMQQIASSDHSLVDVRQEIAKRRRVEHLQGA